MILLQSVGLISGMITAAFFSLQNEKSESEWNQHHEVFWSYHVNHKISGAGLRCRTKTFDSDLEYVSCLLGTQGQQNFHSVRWPLAVDIFQCLRLASCCTEQPSKSMALEKGLHGQKESIFETGVWTYILCNL